MDRGALTQEVERNFDFFQRNLGHFLRDHAGKFALLRHRAVIDFFDKPGEANLVGADRFSDGLYSIQQVTDEPVDLGLYSNAAG